MVCYISRFEKSSAASAHFQDEFAFWPHASCCVAIVFFSFNPFIDLVFIRGSTECFQRTRKNSHKIYSTMHCSVVYGIHFCVLSLLNVSSNIYTHYNYVYTISVFSYPFDIPNRLNASAKPETPLQISKI